ncbi:UvrB/UvrC motif-containing protein [Eubacteriales bacterium OttesenSCG-928-K08]|nr:UvrB/UvrC motif-containing protein [Eubacteriales bacterium OttesenSCG-928-K08]
MICESCKKNQASVHTINVVNGVKQEHYLCEECARRVQGAIPSLMGLLAGFYSMPQQEMETESCSCGYTLAHFQKTGLLGCPECYETYREQLLPSIKRVQGGRLKHVGRAPDFAQDQATQAPDEAAKNVQQAEPVDERVHLKQELELAIKEERYERAAELRDRLKALEGADA